MYLLTKTNQTGNKMNIFGQLINDETSVAVLHTDTGERVTQLDSSYPILYPVDSGFSTLYEHPNGIILSLDDANRIGLDIE
jgi:hypothetical protein